MPFLLRALIDKPGFSNGKWLLGSYQAIDIIWVLTDSIIKVCVGVKWISVSRIIANDSVGKCWLPELYF